MAYRHGAGRQNIDAYVREAVDLILLMPRLCGWIQTGDFWDTALDAGLYPLLVPKDPDQVRARKAEAHLVRLANAREEQAEEIRICLERGGLDFRWIKGWRTRNLWPDPSWRIAQDLDLWLFPGSVRPAARLLQASGYRCMYQARAWPANYELNLLDEMGNVVELHGALGPWSLFGSLSAALWRQTTNDGWDAHLVHWFVHAFQHGLMMKGYQWMDLFLLVQMPGALQEASRLLQQYRWQTLIAWTGVKLQRAVGKVENNTMSDLAVTLLEHSDPQDIKFWEKTPTGHIQKPARRTVQSMKWSALRSRYRKILF